MNEMTREKTTFYIKKENQEKFDEVLLYLSQQKAFQTNSLSENINEVLSIFYDLFIESGKDAPLPERLQQLKNIQPKDSKKLLAETNFLKRQLDILMYVSLANFQLGKKGKQFALSELSSIETSTDKDQQELMTQILKILQRDIERGQVIKHSKRKNKN